MNLDVYRTDVSANATFGTLAVPQPPDAPLALDTLEPLACIPPGTYAFVRRLSPRLKYTVWTCADGVPGYSDIEIHIGNFARDTEGCTLLGLTRGLLGPLTVNGVDSVEPAVLKSQAAFLSFMAATACETTLVVTYHAIGG